MEGGVGRGLVIGNQKVAFGGLFAHPGSSNIFISDVSKRKKVYLW